MDKGRFNAHLELIRMAILIRGDGTTPTNRQHVHFGLEDGDDVPNLIVEAVASSRGKGPTELSPIGAAIDLDGLATVTRDASASVRFETNETMVFLDNQHIVAAPQIT